VDIFPVRRGTALDVIITLTDDQGDPITTYAGTEPLSAYLWPGGSLPPLFSPSASWISGPSGTIQLFVTAAQTAGLKEGRHKGTLDLLDPALGLLEAYAWAIDVLLAPGTQTLGLAYCAYADMLRHGRLALKKLQLDDDLAGFAAEIDDASRWLDDYIIARYPTSNVALLGDPGYGALLYGNSPGALPNQWLRGVLAGGGLVVRPKVAEAVAKRALAALFKNQVGKDAEEFRVMGRRLETESSGVAATLVAEICTDGSGVPTFGIPLGYTSVRPLFF
jgi:hypothetical protein